MDQKLSGQRAALEQGQNPLPLYLSLNVKENNLKTFDFKGIVLSPVHSTLQYTHAHTHACTHSHLCTLQVSREFKWETPAQMAQTAGRVAILVG